MANGNELWLGQSGEPAIELTQFGRKFTRETIEITREGRTASGRLVQDIIAKKQKFIVAYSMISRTDLEYIAALYALDSELEFTVRNDDGTDTTYTVILRPFNQERIFVIHNTTYWGGVTLEMEEV